MSNRSFSERRESSSKILIITILLSVIVCVLAVLIWISVLKTQEITGSNQNPVQKYANETEEEKPTDSEQLAIQKTSEVADQNISLSIAQVLDKIKPEAADESVRPGEDYLTSSDVLSGTGTADSFTGESLGISKRAQDIGLSGKSVSEGCVRYIQHTVQNGETVGSIAQMYGITDSTIVSVNQLKNMMSVTAGSVLSVPDRDGSLYVVREGDTIESVIRKFSLSVSIETITEVNGLKSEEIIAGQKLFIPYDSKKTDVSFVSPCSGSVSGMFNTKQTDPLSGEEIQLNGILMQSEAGQAVVASADGTVVDRGFNSNGSGYVKIMHQSGYTTFYDYLSDICVEASDKVTAGDVIGYFADNTTNLPYPTILFRIEQAGQSLDPCVFI